MPDPIWAFALGKLDWAPNPDPGTLKIHQDYFLAKSVSYWNGNTLTFQTTIIGEMLIIPAIEFVSRRIFGLIAATLVSIPCYSIGLVIAALHQTAIQLQRS